MQSQSFTDTGVSLSRIILENMFESKSAPGCAMGLGEHSSKLVVQFQKTLLQRELSWDMDGGRIQAFGNRDCEQVGRRGIRPTRWQVNVLS